METYEVIDMENFDRADYFKYFMNMGTTIEFTAKIDVTTAIRKCKSEFINFQAYMLFKLYKVMNIIKNFKYDIVDGKPIEWEKDSSNFFFFQPKHKVIFYTLCRYERELL